MMFQKLLIKFKTKKYIDIISTEKNFNFKLEFLKIKNNFVINTDTNK